MNRIEKFDVVDNKLDKVSGELKDVLHIMANEMAYLMGSDNFDVRWYDFLKKQYDTVDKAKKHIDESRKYMFTIRRRFITDDNNRDEQSQSDVR